MKGIVVDINNKDAVILSDDGVFKKIKNRNYEIGQTLQIRDGGITGLKQIALKPLISSKLMAGAARIAAVLTIGTIGAFAWYTPTDYVSLDVNPSVEYTVNMFDRILDVRAVNEDGEAILSGLKLKNKNIGTGLRETLDELIAEGYLADDPDSGVVIATSNDMQIEAEKMAQELKLEVQTYLDAKEDVTAKVDAGAASPAKVQEAKTMGVTPGKLHLVEKLQASTSSAIDMQQWLTKPVKDINKEIKKNRETDQTWNWGQTQNRIQNWAQPEVGGSKSGNDRNSGSNGRGNGNNGSQDKNTYQTWKWNQNQTQSRNQENDQDENKGKNQDQNWNQYRDQEEDQGQTKITSPAINTYQAWDWKQYLVKPRTSGSVGGSKGSSSNEDSKDNSDNEDSKDNSGNKNNKDNSDNKNNKDNSDNKDNSGNKSGGTSDQDSGEDQGRDQTDSGYNGGWTRSEITTPGKIQTTAPAQTIYPKWNKNQNTDQNTDQKKNQNQGQSKKQSQNWDQDWSRNWSQPSGQNQNGDWNQPDSRNQTTPGATGNGGYGSDWNKSGGQNKDDGDDRSDSKSRKSRNND